MNVYVRELSAALARWGVECEVFTRTESVDSPPVVDVEPGFRVHHVPAGPRAPVPKERLPELVDAWTRGVGARIDSLAASGRHMDAIHANYWLSGIAGHALKHQYDLPLLVTFHTLDRVKADASPEEIWSEEPARRAEAEAVVVGCADAVVASCSVEAEQLVQLYGADPDRIVIVAPGVDHAFFSPGEQSQARRALGLEPDKPMVLFAGRIQPLKGLTVAVDALAAVRREAAAVRSPVAAVGGGASAVGGQAAAVRSEAAAAARLSGASLIVLGGPSGPHGEEEVSEVRRRILEHGLQGAVSLLPPQRHEILSTFYRAADVCVVPSHSESFGLVALEASACGIPVVASAVGGLTTLVDHGRTGFLVEGRSAEDYAPPLAILLADPALARQLGKAGSQRASAYTWRAAASALWARVDELTSAVLVACG
jgi:D-inositol-3-phosphate glycosyltransferase